MTESKDTYSFSDVLASSVHDMKNSISMLLTTMDEILIESESLSPELVSRLSHIQYEAKRANSSLIQLLTLYRVGNRQYPLNISHHVVMDFLEEVGLMARDLLRTRGIGVEVDCQVTGSWFFDRELVSGVLNNVLNNAFRYARSRLKISAFIEDDFLVFSVDDDGDGYPAGMLTGRISDPRGVNFKTGSTGLGVYFSATAARIHENAGRTGYVALTNHGLLGGAQFRIGLP